MPRFFIANFDFEDRLAERSDARSRLGAQLLAPVWQAVASADDIILPPDPDPEAARSRVPRLDRGMDIEVIPWGWDSRAVAFAQAVAARPRAIPDPLAVAHVNSREFACQCETELFPAQNSVWPITSSREFVSTTSSLENDVAWILKPNFSFAGRNCLRGRGMATSQHVAWLQKRLKTTGDRPAFFVLERQLEAVAEFGLQLDIPATGPIRTVGLVRNVVSSTGAWLGCQFAPPGFAEWNLYQEHISRTISCVAQRMQSRGYFGPAGFDIMVYSEKSGTAETRVRPLQDINARWTMGRLALEWQQKLAAGRFGFWWHLRHRSVAAADEIVEAVRQQFRTSDAGVDVMSTNQRACNTSEQTPLRLETFLFVADELASLPAVNDIQRFRL